MRECRIVAAALFFALGLVGGAQAAVVVPSNYLAGTVLTLARGGSIVMLAALLLAAGVITLRRTRDRAVD